jgi:outer membrane protein assembly factor BamD (BamD/ComL family)
MVRKSSIDSIKANGDKMGDITLHVTMTREFLDLIKRLEALPEMQKCTYDETKSLYQAVSKNKDKLYIERELGTFFGKPIKAAGENIPLKLRMSPSIKYLGGIREEQTLFIRKTKSGVYYGALWPWQKKPENVTVHLGFISNNLSDKDFKRLEKATKSKVLNERVIEELDANSDTKVHGLGLAAFLQTTELEKISCTLTIKRNGMVGYLYIYKGEITYAETYGLKNKEAAYEIVSWRDTEVEIKNECEKKKNTVNDHLMNILKKALALRKEDKAALKPAVTGGIRTLAQKNLDKQKRRIQRKKELNKKRLVILLIILAISIIGLVVSMKTASTVYFTNKYEDALKAVEEQTDMSGKIAVLREFIQSDPGKSYVDQAEKRIEEIINKYAKKDYDQILRKVKSLPIDAEYEAAATRIYTQFLKKYPESKYSKDVNTRLRTIPEFIDEAEYKKIGEVDPSSYDELIDAHQSYLAGQPEGKYREKVEASLINIKEEYFIHIQNQIPVCEQQGTWNSCILLLENYNMFFQGNSRANEIKALKAEMIGKRDLAILSQRVKNEAADDEAARKIYLDYLESNPSTPQREIIMAELDKIDQKLSQQNEWKTLVAFYHDRDNAGEDKTIGLQRYIDKNPSSPFVAEAKSMLANLKAEEKQKRNERLEDEKRRRQEEAEAIQAEEMRAKARMAEKRRNAAAQIARLRGRFADNGNGTVTDKKTGLMWVLLDSKAVSGKCLDYDSAKKYTKALRTGGYRDWRLPTAKDLAGLYKNPPYFPDFGVNWYWSSETFTKGYHNSALVVTTVREKAFKRKHVNLEACGVVRAVRKP